MRSHRERWTTALARRLSGTQDGRSLSWLIQLPLSWVMLIFWLASIADGDGRQALAYTAFVLVAALLCLGLLLPWRRLPRRAAVAIPVLDFAAIALSGGTAEEYRPEISMLVVFPVVWLAVSGVPARWTLPVTLAGTVLVTLPPLLLRRPEAMADQIAFTMLMPLVMTALAAAVHATSANQRAQAREIRRQQHILERTLAESQQSEDLLRATLEAIDVGVLVLDRTGRPILRNARQERHRAVATSASGDAPGQGRGTDGPVDPLDETALLVFCPDRTTPVAPDRRPLARAAAGEEFSHQLIWVGEGQDQRALSVTARTTGVDGDRTGAVLAFTDVTDLMEALAAKDQLLSHVTHDLRSPLTAILGRADLVLERDDLPEASRRDLESVIRSAERLQTMVQDLLFSASGTFRVSPRWVDLKELAVDGVASAARVAADADVELVLDAPEQVPAFADPMRVLQVLDNLISNAIKYSPDGGRVVVRVRPSGWLASQAVLEVVDHGEGMTDFEARKVFDRFFRTERARSRKVPGVGLGLYVTKAIVDAHGGTVVCRSRPGQGTTFRVTLPVEDAAEQAA